MNFGEKNIQRKKAKDLKSELKQIRKQMIFAGCEKNQVHVLLKELEEILQSAAKLRVQYTNSREHLEHARSAILKLLDCMGVSPAQEVKQSLNELVDELNHVYHDCSIRQDDMDYQSTITCFTEMVSDFAATSNAMAMIMLRSELENIKAVLDDAACWNAPDFFALAYFYLHEDSDRLRDIENEQRNRYVLEYLEENFMGQLRTEITKTGQENQITEFIHTYIYQDI